MYIFYIIEKNVKKRTYIFHIFEKKCQKIQDGGGGAKTSIFRNYPTMLVGIFIYLLSGYVFIGSTNAPSAEDSTQMKKKSSTKFTS